MEIGRPITNMLLNSVYILSI